MDVARRPSGRATPGYEPVDSQLLRSRRFLPRLRGQCYRQARIQVFLKTWRRIDDSDQSIVRPLGSARGRQKRSRSRATLDVLPRRGHVDPGFRLYGQSQNHQTPRQIWSHARGPGRPCPALLGAPRRDSPSSSCAGGARSSSESRQPRETGQPRTGGHSDGNDSESARSLPEHCQGDRRGDHQRPADNHNPARDQRSAQRERGYC
jgi:hypothetical protein